MQNEIITKKPLGNITFPIRKEWPKKRTEFLKGHRKVIESKMWGGKKNKSSFQINNINPISFLEKELGFLILILKRIGRTFGNNNKKDLFWNLSDLLQKWRRNFEIAGILNEYADEILFQSHIHQDQSFQSY